MNIITIDPSTTCTGICINGNAMIAVAQESLALSKNGNLSKWFELVSNSCEIKTYEVYKKKKSFTDCEIEKLKYYQNIAKIIIDTIEQNYTPNNTKVYIEGFSYNSKNGNLIDLVTFSTLIRNNLLNSGYELNVIPPASLKRGTAEMIYPKVDVNNKDRDPSLKPHKPKYIHLNPLGVPGGKFRKHEMLRAIKDSNFIEDWKKFIDKHYPDISEMRTVPAPVADLNDAYLLYKLAEFIDNFPS